MKYKITALGRKVCVRNRELMLYHHPAISEDEANEISDWVTLTGIGYRVAYDQWQLDSNHAIMMFKLRWTGQ